MSDWCLILANWLGYDDPIESKKAGPSEEYDKTRGRRLTNNQRKSSSGVTRTHLSVLISRVAPGRCTMGDRITNRQVLKHKAESLTEPEIAEVLDYINIMESLRDQASKPDLFDDELMNLLADALENRRARVVTEWDRVRRRADNHASTFLSSRKLM